MGLTQTYPSSGYQTGKGRRSPRVRTLAGLIFGLILCLSFTTIGWGNKNQLQSTSVMLDVVDAPLSQVVRMLTQQSGVNIIISGSADLSSKKVTARLDGLPLDKVLDYIVTSADVSLRRMEDGTYLIGSSLPALPEAAPKFEDTKPAEVQPAPESHQAPKRKVVTEVIKLVHSAPGDILRALGVKQGYNHAVTTSGNMDDQYPWKPTTPGKPISYPNGRSTDFSMLNVPPAAPTSDLGPVPHGEAYRSSGFNDQAYQYTPTPRPGFPGGTAAPERPATTPQPVPGAVGQSQQGLLPPGIEFVMAYDIDNSLIVRGTPEALGELKDLISRYLDIPPMQVSIKAEFIEVSASDVDKLGIDWQIDTLNRSFSTNFNPQGNVLLGVAVGNVTAELRAELTQGKGRVVNSPIVSTLNNTPASIAIGQYIPYFQGTTVTPGQGQTVTSYQVIQLPVQTYLFVLPRVNGDKSITLYLEPNVQDTGRIFKSPDGQELPETRNQTLRTNRRVMNGETIVVGGFIRRIDSVSTSKVPLLGDLPLIGGLFRSTSRSQEDRELLIFLTPTIIPEKGGTTLGVAS